MRKDNAFEAFGWNVYDFSGTWASPLDRCIASTISSKVKASETALSQVFGLN
jgi:hypothetical protein